MSNSAAMNWERVNVWSSALYTIVHSLQFARERQFGDITGLDRSMRMAAQWIPDDCSYSSALLSHQGGRYKLTFRRDPEKHFDATAKRLICMLLQDLVVIFDQMMDEALAAKSETAGTFPQSKIEKLRKRLPMNYQWSADGCLELVAVRNVLCHAGGRWNAKSIQIVKGILDVPPQVGEDLSVGFTMLFRYRKAMRTFLNQV